MRLVSQYSIPEYDAAVLTQEKKIADFLTLSVIWKDVVEAAYKIPSDTDDTSVSMTLTALLYKC